LCKRCSGNIKIVAPHEFEAKNQVDAEWSADKWAKVRRPAGQTALIADVILAERLFGDSKADGVAGPRASLIDL
jgi:hypothetical protein